MTTYSLDPNLTGLDVLGDYHREALVRAVRNVLDTDIALEAYAQIIDGLPTYGVSLDTWNGRHYLPLATHVEVCPAAKEKAEQILSNFDPWTLRFEYQLLKQFRDARPTSRAFDLRLIELVAVSIHQIAVLLHHLGLQLHDPKTTDGKDAKSITTEIFKEDWTLFQAGLGANWQEFPDKMHDVVGYWAENAIFGGIVLFRRSSRQYSECRPEPNVFFNATRYRTTYYICQLLDEQQNRMLQFFTSTDPDAPSKQCPFPILLRHTNRKRFHPVDAIPNKIYRDRYERKEMHLFSRIRERRVCVANPIDHPTLWEWRTGKRIQDDE